VEPIVSDKDGARPADLPQAHEGTETTAKDSHLRSIRGANGPVHAADRAASKAMRRLMQETFSQMPGTGRGRATTRLASAGAFSSGGVSW
jgi:hypothetical protein